ncbi:hypothetical protein [Aromatoleum buckelii]|uniref:Uncharacterized protein n=1 Tax=Aromatoleum buckelii TaxID=200254 RepID=A0ABX1N5Y8_9RHOO|nr:hypothetical protein [Aromatoleum buckelii]MCK0509605.1 hypothetical protein [Aromatoleum buckelii]
MKANSARKLAIACALALTGIAGVTTGAVAGNVQAPLVQAEAKLQTDTALEQGMLNIRAIVEQSLPQIRADQFGDERYNALGKAIETQVAYIVKNCKLEPAADGVLHDVLGEVSSGIDRVTAKTAENQRTHGVSYIIAALDSYGRRFDHAGWTPIKVVP